MAPASFSSLPPELVSMICSDPGLEKKDLIALRLTSKSGHIHASATKAFGKLCFTDVPLIYTRYSLETFVKICGHPVFGPCIRKVKLSCIRFDSHNFNGCRVPKLEIAVAARRFSHDSDYDLSDLMHSISEVELELTFINDYGDDEPRDFILWIRDLLSHGTSIKSLEFCPMIFDDYDNRKIEPFFQVISRLPLEKLDLHDFSMSQKAMTDLLESLGSTLRCLAITCCDMAGSWREVVVSIQQNCSQLDYLQISDGRTPWLRSWKAYEGTTAVRSGLEKMLRAEQGAAEDSEKESDDP
ncbi:hypothetical protein KCU95_g7668, partial [Aureobasidium melanogenum]